MSVLQVIPEEDSDLIKKNKRNTYGDIYTLKSDSVQQKTNKETSKNSTPKGHSEYSPFSESHQDVEIEKIKVITNTLSSNIKSELKNHKQLTLNYLESNKSLHNIVKNYSNEIEEAKTAAYNAFVESYQNCEDIKKMRESVLSRESIKTHEEQSYNHNCNEINPDEVLKSLRSEIQVMQERLYKNELVIEEKEKENNELKLYINKCHEIRASTLEGEEKKFGCGKCIIS
ncbi:hypothetical protein SteCoe_20553 [Stentor coeruleus]|uniref:Uncharacterized protein n=1 Tax=Stentor coeruleus TaxID=5963 RepID=A0A1R2BRX8_9CILI|nr:hypothetical protein SteCoe_20553 [Stentor coeruleus]